MTVGTSSQIEKWLKAQKGKPVNETRINQARRLNQMKNAGKRSRKMKNAGKCLRKMRNTPKV